jgi:phospholipase C
MVPAPDPAVPKGQQGFDFRRSGYRVPAVMISPWIPEKTVFTKEYRHTSMIATLRKNWNLGKPLTARDANSRTLDTCFTLKSPRDPSTWPNPVARPVPEYKAPDLNNLPPAYSGLARAMIPGVVKLAHATGFPTPSMPKSPDGKITPLQGIKIALELANEMFPNLASKKS